MEEQSLAELRKEWVGGRGGTWERGGGASKGAAAIPKEKEQEKGKGKVNGIWYAGDS